MSQPNSNSNLVIVEDLYAELLKLSDIYDSAINTATESSLEEFKEAIEKMESLLEVFSGVPLNYELNHIIDFLVHLVGVAHKVFYELEASRGKVGRPKVFIPKETLVELRGLGLSWNNIARLLGVSRWTVSRRAEEYNIRGLGQYSSISDDQLDIIVKDFINRHGRNTGQPFISGHLVSIGHFVQRRRVRESLNRVDPLSVTRRWGIVNLRRTYYVPWCNSVWHIDGHHSLIRWKFVIHGCIDGKSRKVMYLNASNNNLAATNLALFHHAIAENRGLWPSRVRVDYGVENVLICDAMVEVRGENRGSFIAGSSHRNQRIERLWRDVFRCVCAFFYYTFYAMEHSGILDVENDSHLYVLHCVFLPRINRSLNEFLNLFNNHKLSTENNLTPNQIWTIDMGDPSNPLANQQVDPVPHDINYYAEDPAGPRPRDPECNNVVVTPLLLEDAETIDRIHDDWLHAHQNEDEISGIGEYEDVLNLYLSSI